jgi:hypothetical protein
VATAGQCALSAKADGDGDGDSDSDSDSDAREPQTALATTNDARNPEMAIANDARWPAEAIARYARWPAEAMDTRVGRRRRNFQRWAAWLRPLQRAPSVAAALALARSANADWPRWHGS